MPKRRPPRPDDTQRQRDHARARQAARNAEQIAREIAAFTRTLPAERTEWDPPKSFNELVTACANLSNDLINYAVWARRLPEPAAPPAADHQHQEEPAS